MSMIHCIGCKEYYDGNWHTQCPCTEGDEE